MCTQFAAPSGRWSLEERCVFNQPLEMHLVQHHSSDALLGLDEKDPLPPRLILQVFQAGAWDRHTLHGYTFVDIPERPGEYDLRVPLWAPLGTITQQLHSKLCG